MTEQPNTDDERTHPEEPAEGAAEPGADTDERRHNQEPAEGADFED